MTKINFDIFNKSEKELILKVILFDTQIGRKCISIDEIRDDKYTQIPSREINTLFLKLDKIAYSEPNDVDYIHSENACEQAKKILNKLNNI